MRGRGGAHGDGIRGSRDRGAPRVRRGDRLAAPGLQSGREGVHAAISSREGVISRQHSLPVTGSEVHRARIAGHRVVERIFRRHREIKRGPGRGRGWSGNGKVRGLHTATIHRFQSDNTSKPL